MVGAVSKTEETLAEIIPAVSVGQVVFLSLFTKSKTISPKIFDDVSFSAAVVKIQRHSGWPGRAVKRGGLQFASGLTKKSRFYVCLRCGSSDSKWVDMKETIQLERFTTISGEIIKCCGALKENKPENLPKKEVA